LCSCYLGGIRKLGSWPQVLQSCVPDFGRFIHAEVGGHQVKPPVDDSGVDVRISARHITSHRRRLRIPAHHGIVISGAGVGHRAESFPIELWRHYAFSNEPIERARVLVIDPRIDTCPEDVAGGLVQGARLVRILEPSGKLRNAVREFMAGNVNVVGEVLKDVAVAVAANTIRVPSQNALSKSTP
jgi:hypothetical protein